MPIAATTRSRSRATTSSSAAAASARSSSSCRPSSSSPAAGIPSCAPRRRCRRWTRSPTAAGSSERRATISTPPIASCARVEHRLQMVGDEQTHTLPAEREALERFARFVGFADRDAFANACVGHLRKVQRHYATLFESAPGARRAHRALLFPAGRRRPRNAGPARRDGLSPAARSVRAGAPLAAPGPTASLKGEFARSQLAELVPVLLDQFARSENPDAARHRFRPLPRRAAWRRPAVLAAAAESRSRRADRARARHRAAAGRHPRAAIPRSWMRWSIRASSARCRTSPKLAAGLDRSLEQAGSLRGLSRSHRACSRRSRCS